MFDESHEVVFKRHQPSLKKWLIDTMEVWHVHVEDRHPDGWCAAEVYACPGAGDWQIEVRWGHFEHDNFWAAELAAREHLTECPGFEVMAALVRSGPNEVDLIT